VAGKRTPTAGEPRRRPRANGGGAMPSYHDLKVGETLDLAGNGQVRVTLVAKSGRRARLAIEADAAVAIRPPHDRVGRWGEEYRPEREDKNGK